MAKYTIEYKRTVRVREYETLTIGWKEEFDTDTNDYRQKYANVKGIVNYHIDRELEQLRKEGKTP